MFAELNCYVQLLEMSGRNLLKYKNSISHCLFQHLLILIDEDSLVFYHESLVNLILAKWEIKQLKINLSYTDV
jgi:hypothetical protein